MKKVAMTLSACLACFQFTQAQLAAAPAVGATSALIESVLEYEAITDCIGGTTPNCNSPIGQTEVIVDIKRITPLTEITQQVTVKYEILTRQLTAGGPGGPGDIAAEVDVEAKGRHSHGSSKRDHHHHKKNRTINHYIATLTITPNPDIGPNSVHVDSIVKVRSQTHTFFNDDEAALIPEVEVSN